MVVRTWLLLGTIAGSTLACSTEETLQGFDKLTSREITNDVSEGQLFEDVTSLYESHVTDRPVDCGSVCNLNALVSRLSHDVTRALVSQRLATLGLSVIQESGVQEPVTFVNLLADIPGRHEPNEIIVVSAHYDAYYGGADDNSTGVAAVLELARVLRSFSFERTIRFAFFDLEELGCRGSSLYTEAHSPDNHPVVLVLDSLGHRKTAPKSQSAQLGLSWPSVGDFLLIQANESASARTSEVELVNDQLDLTKLHSIIAPDDGDFVMTAGLLNGDHIPFWLAGFPTLNFSDTDHFRDDCSHTERDVPSAVDGAFLAENVRLVASAIAYFAGVLPR